ncbi:MAG: hypothetical protein ACTSUG_13575 [Candidatus Helarchaeota archaeon]
MVNKKIKYQGISHPIAKINKAIVMNDEYFNKEIKSFLFLIKLYNKYILKNKKIPVPILLMSSNLCKKKDANIIIKGEQNIK